MVSSSACFEDASAAIAKRRTRTDVLRLVLAARLAAFDRHPASIAAAVSGAGVNSLALRRSSDSKPRATPN